MKVSRKSWHYRLMVFLNSKPWYQTNLCGYFWELMACLFFKIPYLLAIVVTAVILSPVWLPLVGLVALFCWVSEKLDERDRRLKKEAGIHPWDDWPQEMKHPGLIRSWLRAKKEKICPMIEYED